LSLFGLSVAVATLIFIGEAIGIGIAFGVSPLRVLSVAFNFQAGIRPGWEVLAAGLAVVVLDFIRSRRSPRTTRRRAVAAE
jgi:sulfoxide reductase heme-binding subunit YedZ